ncbi:S-ribosylhomocysteinase, partial [Listeria fleischmannii subsp. fleischmannii LU2006-1]
PYVRLAGTKTGFHGDEIYKYDVRFDYQFICFSNERNGYEAMWIRFLVRATLASLVWHAI